MDGRKMIVAKVGGSLLDLPDLPSRLAKWIASQSPQMIVFVPGGGPAVEDIRRRCRTGEIANEDAHWLAIEAMGRNAVTLAAVNSEFKLARSLMECEGFDQRNLVLDPCADLKADGGRTLPIGWHVTSDSIAAWISIRLRSDRLALVKSVGTVAPIALQDAVERGWIDSHFPALFPRLPPVEWVNLRQDPPLPTSLASTQRNPAGSS